MKKVIFGVLMIAMIGALVGIGTWAYFTDIETTPEQSFIAGTLDLQVDNLDDPIKSYFAMVNQAPGDADFAIINLSNIGSIGGVASIQFVELVDLDNDITEPEDAVYPPNNDDDDGTADGDLSKFVMINITADVGNIGAFEPVLLAPTSLFDLAAGGLITIGTLDANYDFPINISYEIPTEPGVGQPADIHNIFQSDSCTFAIEFTLVQGEVTPPTPLFSNPVIPTPLEQCTVGTISVDLENVGDVPGIFTVDLTITGPVGYSASKDVGLAPEDPPETVSFDWHPSPFDPTGDYYATLECCKDAVCVSEEGPIVVTAPAGAAFWLKDLAWTPLEPKEGEDVEISFTVWNFGKASGNYTATLTLTLDSEDVFSGSELVTVGPGLEELVSFDWVAGVAGAYAVSADTILTDTMTVVEASAADLVPGAGSTWVYDVHYEYDSFVEDGVFTDINAGVLPGGLALALSTSAGLVIGVLDTTVTPPTLTTIDHPVNLVPPGTVLDDILEHPGMDLIAVVLPVGSYLTLSDHDVQLDPTSGDPISPVRYLDVPGIGVLEVVSLDALSLTSVADLNATAGCAPFFGALPGVGKLTMAALLATTCVDTAPGYPYDVGETWESTSEAMAPISYSVTTSTVEVAGIEVVTVPAGTFTCYVLETYDDEGELTGTEWWSPQVKGVVKMANGGFEGSETHELTAYIPVP